jgi:hypothetical protein
VQPKLKEGLLSNPISENAESYEFESRHEEKEKVIQVLPFGRTWTSNVIYTLLAQAFFDFQMG